jgi:hypothetical protein
MKADGVRGHDDYCFRFRSGATSVQKRAHTNGTKDHDGRCSFYPQISGTL